MHDMNDLYLIVDDEPDMCWVLKKILERKGVSCKIAIDGRQTLGLLKKYRFKSVFLDAKLPDIDGIELAEKIRQIDPRIPVFLVSGYFYRDDKAVAAAFEKGLITGFVSKPFQNSQITCILESTANIAK